MSSIEKPPETNAIVEDRTPAKEEGSSSAARSFSSMESAIASTPEKLTPSDSPALPCQRSWIAIELYENQDQRPVGGQMYEISRLCGQPLRAGETVIRGHLDPQGYAREDNIDGMEECVVAFPGLPEQDVEPMPPDFWTGGAAAA